MKSISNTIKRLFFNEAFKAPELADFDPVFYGAYYVDLHHLKSAKKLQRHYVRYGSREGRWKNLTEAKNSFTSRFGPLPDDFQTAAYKQTNRDLAYVFDHEWQYEFHYLEQGRKEGRNYKLEGEGHWKSFFRLADFVVCAQGWMEEIPLTKEEGMALFLEAGIGRLTPINLDLTFDPEFYRSAYGFKDEATGATLYRHWLEIGLPRGLSPNEERALICFVSSPRYPEAFDWRRYKLALPRKVGNTLRHRVDVLRHLIMTGFEKGLAGHIDGVGSDDLFAEIGDFHLTGGRPHIAIAAYDLALALNPLHPGAQHRRGDAHAALGKIVAAHYDYVAAIRHPHASIWSTVHAAHTAVANGSFERSFQILRDGRKKWEKSTVYRTTVTEIIEQVFAAKSKSAMSLYDAGDRDVADAYMLKALEELRDRIVELETLPCEIAPFPHGHVSILANQDLAQCKHYRVEQKLRQLRAAGIKTEVFNQHDPIPFIRSLLGARAAIFYRVPAFPTIIKAILTAKSLGVPTHYEIDDLIFDAAYYPDTFESYEGQISRLEYNGLCYGVPLFRFAMGLCDYGIASTPLLAGQMETLVRKQFCFVVRNGLDERNDRAIDMARMPRPQRDVVTIFYGSGTKAHNSDFNDLAAPALLSALERYDNVHLVIVGHLRLHCEFDRFSSRVQQLGFVNDLDQYWSLLAASDINLAVLSPGLMASCKSEIKWLEAAVLQVPSIVSATQTYIEVLEDGVDALIVDNHASAWTSALNRLIEDPDLRRSMGASARSKALQNYSIEQAADLWCKRFAGPFAAIGEDKKCRLKIRVLVCAVFFPPQSYGGATRVVQDNVDYFKDECPDIELSVFTTDDGVSPAGQFRFDQYRGIPVFRLSTSIEPNMDWRPFNVGHEGIFDQIVDAVQPDVVHFHCIQRLTASIVEVALKRKIPYLITVHDGWWISDHQFLIDQNDRLRLPSSNYFDAAPPSGVSLI
jgi:glycosyltransferase involved in cell wall biosynthesis